jgi:hypothetical protein
MAPTTASRVTTSERRRLRTHTRACCTAAADVPPVLVERHGFRLPGSHFRSPTLDLRVPGLSHAGLRLSIETPLQLKSCQATSSSRSG